MQWTPTWNKESMPYYLSRSKKIDPGWLVRDFARRLLLCANCRGSALEISRETALSVSSIPDKQVFDRPQLLRPI
jgi:hypothetical protein